MPPTRPLLGCLRDDAVSTLVAQNRRSSFTSGWNRKKFNYQTKKTHFLFLERNPTAAQSWKNVSENIFFFFKSRLTVSRIWETMYSRNATSAFIFPDDPWKAAFHPGRGGCWVHVCVSTHPGGKWSGRDLWESLSYKWYSLSCGP